MRYQVHVRSQHAKRGKSGFSGPDAYVAVTVAPDGVEVPKYLNRDILKRRGIEIRFFGEGYRQYHGPKSALGQAIAAAKAFADQQGGAN